jgi:hypothetical protein
VCLSLSLSNVGSIPTGSNKIFLTFRFCKQNNLVTIIYLDVQKFLILNK